MGHLSKAKRNILMEQALSIVRKNPEISFKRLSETLGLSKSMVQQWYANDVDGFKDKYDEALKYAFNRLEGLAIKALGDLIVDGSFQATKYVLDNRGYKAEDKTKLTVDGNMDINIVIDDDEFSDIQVGGSDA